MTRDPLFLVAVNLFVAVLARSLKPNLLTAMLLAVVLIASTAYLGTQRGDEIVDLTQRARVAVLSAIGVPPEWAPQKGLPLPDVAIVDDHGNPTRLANFRGKVILLELVSTSCPACVAFSGGHIVGPFRDTSPQPDLQAIAEYAEQFGHVRLEDPDIVYMQLILFNEKLAAPTAAEISAWANHFAPLRSKNQFVLGGTASLASEKNQNLVPGFLLIDKDFVVRMDSTGTQPADDLYADLLPLLAGLIKN